MYKIRTLLRRNIRYLDKTNGWIMGDWRSAKHTAAHNAN